MEWVQPQLLFFPPPTLNHEALNPSFIQLDQTEWKEPWIQATVEGNPGETTFTVLEMLRQTNKEMEELLFALEDQKVEIRRIERLTVHSK